jgi:hypothetical protein
MEYETKDSGERLKFDSGMQRDVDTDKSRFDLVPTWFVSFMQRTHNNSLRDAYSTYIANDSDIISGYSGINLYNADVDDDLEQFATLLFTYDARFRPTSYAEIFKNYGELLTRGANKYADNNWMQANGPIELKRFYQSGFRHLVQYLNNERDEDHFSAVLFNIMGMFYLIKQGVVLDVPKDDKLLS